MDGSQPDTGIDAEVSDGVAPLDGGTGIDASSAMDAAFPLVDTCGDAGAAPGSWVADSQLCLSVYASKITLARQLAFAPNGDLFVESSGSIVANADLDKNGVISEDESITYVAAAALGLNHGLAFSPDGAFVYASSESTVYRWAYAVGDRVASGAEQIVVSNMPVAGHNSRSLAFDAMGRLYVNVGSLNDVEFEADLALRSQVRRFALPSILPAGGVDYATGEVFASGLRNEVGLAFGADGRMWGVENGSDGIDLPPGAVGEPAEEINRLDAPGARFYGYSHCWTEYGFDGGLGNKTAWAYLVPDASTDAWCRDPANAHPPAGAMRGHWAPLGVVAYAGHSLPWAGDLLVTSHGSPPGRVPMVGRLVARAHLVGDDVVSVAPIVGHLVDGGFEEGTWDARPVDIKVGPDGAVYVSDDEGSRIFRLGYRP